jgi:hypothetical protein
MDFLRVRCTDGGEEGMWTGAAGAEKRPKTCVIRVGLRIEASDCRLATAAYNSLWHQTRSALVQGITSAVISKKGARRTPFQPRIRG